MANIYDFEKINTEIPIEEVLAFHGIYPSSNKKMGEGWYSIRPEDDTPSAHIDKQRRYGNTVHDFGIDNTFNPISLTMYLQNCDAKEAATILGDSFGIEPMYRDNDKQRNEVVSDFEWAFIGIQPDMVSKNLDLNVEKYGEKRTRDFVSKYTMPIIELKKTDVLMYERIMRSRAIPYVKDLYNEYYNTMYSEHSFAKTVNKEFTDEFILKNSFDKFEQLAKDLIKAENILKKALKGTSLKYKFSRFDVKTDFYKVIQGGIEFEIGDTKYNDIKSQAWKDKTKLFYCPVTLDEYNKLMDNGLSGVRVAAFQKGDKVNLAFLPSESDRVNFLVRALRGKERGLGDISAEAKEIEQQTYDDVVIKSNQTPVQRAEIDDKKQTDGTLGMR